jgi:hypothetical protein
VIHSANASSIGRGGGSALEMPATPSDSNDNTQVLSETAPWIEIPTGLWENLDREATIGLWSQWRGPTPDAWNQDWQWVYSIGKNQSNTLQLTPSYAYSYGTAPTAGEGSGIGFRGTAAGGAPNQSEVTVRTTNPLPYDGTWTQLTVVVNSSSVKYYVGGIKVGEAASTLDLGKQLTGGELSGLLGRPRRAPRPLPRHHRRRARLPRRRRVRRLPRRPRPLPPAPPPPRAPGLAPATGRWCSRGPRRHGSPPRPPP